jgi:hypothetical protein
LQDKHACPELLAMVVCEPGEYRLRLFAGDEFIMERWLVATQLPVSADEDEP